jgi:predicted amidohydrolase
MTSAGDKQVQVAAAQIAVSLADKNANLDKCLHFLQQAARQHVELLVFPECALTGYVFNSFDEAFKLSETVPGETTQVLEKACREYGIATVVGLLEQDGGRLYNTAVLIASEGLVGKYRKTHTLCLGVDRYISRGEELPVFSTSHGRVGMLICYDLRFPETARSIALRGAQVILNPTNLPRGGEAYASFLNQARACENRIFLISVNRVGVERDVRFIGRSQIVDSFGRILAEGSDRDEEFLRAEITPRQADLKHVVVRPGEYEFDTFGDRRPELYEPIIHGRL